MTNRYFIAFLLFAIVFITSCDKYYHDGGVPSFVHIDKIDFQAGLSQGTDSQYIADAWIYVGNEYIGTYELPATFPVLKTGEQNIVVKPGVILDGISATRSINPFMEPVTKHVNLIADSTVSLNVSTTYVSNAVFPWNTVGQEGFEGSGISIDSLPGSSTNIYKSKNDVYEGDYSGMIHLDVAHRNFTGATVTSFDLPKNKSGMLMEINIKNTGTIVTIGLFFNLPGGTVSKEEYLFVNPGDHWKKLYVNFTKLVNRYSNAENFKVFFKAELPSELNQTDIFLDNIKLIHF